MEHKEERGDDRYAHSLVDFVWKENLSICRKKKTFISKKALKLEMFLCVSVKAQKVLVWFLHKG